jgi:large subunit ribosomal protein L5e
MGLVKVQKNKAYFKRFQTKFRRRRENKTDYYARKRLVIQDKNKYATPKHRLVVRATNKDFVVQVFASQLDKDVCIAAAYASELRRFGLKVSTNNYAAAYATGLLLARRVNAKFNIEYEGQKEVDGEVYKVEENAEDRRPFKAFLDVGLARTTVGARIFGALKGAADGGLHVPHNEKKFPGSSQGENKEWQYDPAAHRDRIFGKHVADWMNELKERDPDAYAKQFSKYIKAGIQPADVEAMWKSVHSNIRAEPNKARGANEKGRFKSK